MVGETKLVYKLLQREDCGDTSYISYRIESENSPVKGVRIALGSVEHILSIIKEIPEICSNCIEVLVNTAGKVKLSVVLAAEVKEHLAGLIDSGWDFVVLLRTDSFNGSNYRIGLCYEVMLRLNRLIKDGYRAEYLDSCEVDELIDDLQSGMNHEMLDVDESNIVVWMRGILKHAHVEAFSNRELGYYWKYPFVEDRKGTECCEIKSSTSGIKLITTPRDVVEQVLDTLPDWVWNEKTTFLDIACVAGDFLSAIYDRLMNNEELCEIYEDPYERGKHILENQLFGLVANEESMEIATRALHGFSDNLIEITDYYAITDADLPDFNKNLRSYVTLKELHSDRNFDVVLGNPPYYKATGGALHATRPVYQNFIALANRLVDKQRGVISMVIPCKWYDETCDVNLRRVRNMLLAHETREIHDFEDSEQLIGGYQVSGGLCYFVHDKRRDFFRLAGRNTCKFYAHPSRSNGLIEERDVPLNDLFCTREFIARDEYVQRLIRRQRAKQILRFRMDESVEKTSPFGFARSARGLKQKQGDANIKLLSTSGIGYVAMKDVKKNKDLVDKYKVYIGYNQSLKYGDLKSVGVLLPGEVCTLSYLVVYSDSNKNMAYKCEKYIKTRFVRALIKATAFTSTITAKNFRFVPTFDFVEHRVNWDVTIAEIDKQLYEIFELDEDEINYIEETIVAKE